MTASIISPNRAMDASVSQLDREELITTTDQSSSKQTTTSQDDQHSSTSVNQKQNEASNQSKTDYNTSPESKRGLKFNFGPYIPLLRKDNNIIVNHEGIVDYYSSPTSKRLTCEILPDDAILEAPSLVTPLLLKKKTIWPKENLIETTGLRDKPLGSISNQDPSASDDVQVVKIVNNSTHSRFDPASNNKKPIGEYIKSTTVASLTSMISTSEPILTLEDYFRSSAGELLVGIGLSRVAEFNLEDTTKRLASKIRRGGDECADLLNELEEVRAQLSQARASNKPYKSEQRLRCPHCLFRSESSTVIDGHLEYPHMSNTRREYMCNWCDSKIKDSDQVVFHNLIEHKKRCKIERPLPLHLCQLCSFECSSKRKMTSHSAKCSQVFPHDEFLGPSGYDENDYPGITSKLITQEDIKSYEQNLKELRLAAYNPHQLKVTGSQNQGANQVPILLVSRHNVPPPSNPSTSRTIYASHQNVNKATASVSRSSFTSTNGSMRGNQHLLHFLSAQQNVGSNQNKLNVLQNPKTQSAFIHGKVAINTASDIFMAPQNPSTYNGTAQNNNRVEGDSIKTKDYRQTQHVPLSGTDISANSTIPKGSTFVICEICDGYIKDLSQLKSHMQWTHKVKIHQKMLESRPPLNCQKCQWRFFTDQGLERHLLGAHGLVTSNMQEQVDNGTDSGRCTVCGRAYANKLVAHMKEVHKSNLKPAHLSYKCTVCSATFNLYRLFENHVYSVHSDSVRRIASN